MPTYKGLPLNGGLNSPTGTGASHIVESFKAIADNLQYVGPAGYIFDATTATAIDVNARNLYATGGKPTLDWQAQRLTDGAAPQLGWTGGFVEILAAAFQVDSTVFTVTNLPTTDPHIANQLWNNGGIVTVSAG